MCDLATIKAELAREEAIVAEIEASVEEHATQLSYLHGEYELNKSRVLHHYEPALRPLREITYAITCLESLINLQIEWHEAKLGKWNINEANESNKASAAKCGGYVEVAQRMNQNARQTLLKSYEAIKNCPEHTLKMISNYSSPPDEAIATMELVMLLRDEEECTWKAAQVIVSYNYFTNFFESRSELLLKKYDLLPEHKMKAIEEFCRHPSHSIQALYISSTPIGCLGQWIHAIRDLYRVKYITAPLLLHDKSATNMNNAKKLLDELTFHQEFDSLIKEAKMQMKVNNDNDNDDDDANHAWTNNNNSDYGVNNSSKTFERQEHQKLEVNHELVKDNNDSQTKERCEGKTNTNHATSNNVTSAENKCADNESEEAKERQERLKALEAEEAAVKKVYKELKERLLYKASGANNDQEMVLLLKHRLNECRQHYNQAMESMSIVQVKIDEALSKVRHEYDGTMIPIEREIEDDTERLISNFSSCNQVEGNNSSEKETVTVNAL